MRFAFGMPWTTSSLMEVQRAGKTVVALEGGDGAKGGDLFDGDALEIHGGRARDHVRRDSVVDLTKDGTGDAHLFNLGGGFDKDGHKVRLLVAGY
jgi:hypothetical protein